MSEPSAETAQDAAADAPVVKRRRRWPWMLLLGGVLLIWFAPALAMNTPLKDTVLRYANPGIDGELRVQNASLGWFSPVVLKQVSVLDPDGNTVARAESVSSQRTLWNLAADSLNLGTFTIRNVQARVEATAETTNLEQLLAPLLTGPSGTDVYAYRIEVDGGTVVLLNSDTGRASQLTDIRGHVAATPFGNSYPEIELTMTAHAGEETAGGGGPLEFKLGWVPATGDQPITGRARVRGEGVDLQTFGPAVHRFLPGTRIAGLVKCDVAADWSDDADLAAFRVRGGLSGRGVHFASPTYLGTDVLRLSAVALAGNMNQSGDDWLFDDVRVRCDLADLRADGAISLERGLPTPGAARPFSLQGSIDVAGLANQLPATIHLQDGTRMTEGQATLTVASEDSGGASFWTARVETGVLRGQRGGREIAWQDPLSVDVRVRNHQASYSIERVSASSEFLTAVGQGSLDDLTLRADCDLNQLKTRLDEFVDLGATELAGRVHVEASLKRDAGGAFVAVADADATNFTARLSEDTPRWHEDALRIESRATGSLRRGQLSQVESLELTVTSGSDRLTSTLMAPVSFDEDTPPAIPMRVRTQGSLSAWLIRGGAFVEIPLRDADGTIDLAADVVVSTDRVTVQDSRLTARNLQVRLADDLMVIEPSVTATAVGRIDLTRQTVTLPKFEWLGTAAQLTGSDFFVSYGEQLQATARCSVVGDLARLSRWRISSEPREPVTGRLQGDLLLASRKNLITVKIDATLENSSLLAALHVQPEQVAGRPTAGAAPLGSAATLACTLRYNQTTETLKVEKARLDADALAIQANGTMRDMTTRMRTDMVGNLAYDFDVLNALLKSTFGDHIRLKGRGSHPFEIHGPLQGKTENLSAAAKVSWETAFFYGLSCGAGEIQATVKRGVLKTQPIKFSLNGGQARILPTVTLTDTPTLTLARGTEIRDVELTQDVTNEWLRYIAPALADSTRVRGRISTGIASATVPLSDPETSDIGGMVWIHTAEAQPGPMVNQLVAVVDQVRTILGKSARGAKDLRLVVPEQKVSFRMLERRVHHQNLIIEIDGLRIRTSGSVGLDETLDLVAELTLPASWLGSDQFAQTLAERPIRIPVTGTFTAPRIDKSFLRTLGGQAASGAANNLIERQIDRGLNRLLDKIK